MKCEGCPMYDPRHYSGTGNPWCNWLGGNIASCHLTPSNMDAIRAMIAGVFKCKHCVMFKDEIMCCEAEGFCELWEERQDQGGE